MIIPVWLRKNQITYIQLGILLNLFCGYSTRVQQNPTIRLWVISKEGSSVANAIEYGNYQAFSLEIYTRVGTVEGIL